MVLRLALADCMNDAVGGDYEYKYDRTKDARREKKMRSAFPRSVAAALSVSMRSSLPGMDEGDRSEAYGIFESHLWERRDRSGEILKWKAGGTL